MRLRILATLCVLVIVTGCARANDPDPPPALNRYLSALEAKDYKRAYQVTDLPQSPDAPGFAMTFEHFQAFYERHPLVSYDVKKVTKLEQRRIEGGAVVGAPAVFVIDMELKYADGIRKESWHIEGDVVGVLQLEAASLTFRTKKALSTITVDGVKTPVRAGGKGSARLYSVTVLNGMHEVELDATTIEVLTQPPTVLSGPATVEDGVIVLSA